MTPAPVALVQALDAADVAGADALECQAWLRDLKRVTGWADALRTRIAARVDELARTGESFGSEQTLVNCSGISAKDAAKDKARHETIEHAPDFGDALAVGDVTADHVDGLAAATAKLDENVKADVFDRQTELLNFATHHSPDEFSRHVRNMARNLERDAGIARDQRQRRDTRLTWRVASDGMYDVHARLHPEAGMKLVTGLQTEVARRVARGEKLELPEFLDRTVDRGRLMAEALVDYVVAGNADITPGDGVIEGIVLVDQQTFETGCYHEDSICETSHGAPLPVASLRRLLCDADLDIIVRNADGTALNLKREKRHANRAQRRALRAMYRTCAAAGCDTPFDKCEIHHIHEWELGGFTDLPNMLPLCAHHHHLVHELGWRLHLAADRTLIVTDRYGNVVMETQPDMPRPRPAAGPTRCRQTEPAEAGVPEPETFTPIRQPALL